jgi:transposase
MMITPDVVGIDVSKHHLDIFDGSTGKAERLPNLADEVGGLAMRLCGRLVVFEATGAYDETLRRALAAAGVAFARINPTQARSFAKAAGFLAKTDQVDARMLAALGSALRPRPAEAADEARERLTGLHKRRDQLVTSRKQERTRRRETTGHDLLAGLDRHLAFLDEEIAAIEAKIASLIAAEPGLQRTYRLLVSIPGVGAVTGACLLARMPELGQRSPKAIAALAGLAPINQDSGLRRGQRSIRGGRKRVRDALYMAAVAAARSNSPLKASYRNLRANGKPAKLAFIAIARKILTVANAIIRDQKPFAA